MAENEPGARKVFITDFDGTITRRDFFWLVVETFAPAHLEHFWDGYREGRYMHFEALAGIFAGIRADEDQMEELLTRAEPDPGLAEWVPRLRDAGWDIVVASAGCEWYIRRILNRAGVDLVIHANPGTFSPEQGLRMTLPVDSPVFSRHLGIDKSALVRMGIEQGKTVAFAGDGNPDTEAALLVAPGLRFARHDLASSLDALKQPYRAFERWSEVARLLCALT